MVNQQLLDYLREQLKAGVSRENVKSSLLNVGWQESDINEAFETLDKENTTTPFPDAVKTQDINLVNLKNISQNINNTLSENISKQNQNSVNSNNIPQYFSKDDFVSSQKDTELKISSEGKKVISDPVNLINKVQPQQVKIESLPHNYKKFKIIIYILFGLLITGLLVAIFLLYQRNNDLENRLNSALSRSGDLESQSQSIMDTTNNLQKQVLALKEENNMLNQQKSDLANQLLLFSQSTSSLDVELGGKILLEKGQYILKTSQNILVSIKNSKDEKVKKVLESFINQDLVAKGIRTPGLREITITDINNQSIDNLFQLELEKSSQNQNTSTTTSTSQSSGSTLNQTTTTE